MGAYSFSCTGSGQTAKAAFDSACQDARYNYGHGGYTGTIAEKDSFVMIKVPENFTGSEEDYADHLISECDPRIDDKWGPAGCIDLGNGKWLFFGWASS